MLPKLLLFYKIILTHACIKRRRIGGNMNANLFYQLLDIFTLLLSFQFYYIIDALICLVLPKLLLFYKIILTCARVKRRRIGGNMNMNLPYWLLDIFTSLLSFQFCNIIDVLIYLTLLKLPLFYEIICTSLLSFQFYGIIDVLIYLALPKLSLSHEIMLTHACVKRRRIGGNTNANLLHQLLDIFTSLFSFQFYYDIIDVLICLTLPKLSLFHEIISTYTHVKRRRIFSVLWYYWCTYLFNTIEVVPLPWNNIDIAAIIIEKISISVKRWMISIVRRKCTRWGDWYILHICTYFRQFYAAWHTCTSMHLWLLSKLIIHSFSMISFRHW